MTRNQPTMLRELDEGYRADRTEGDVSIAYCLRAAEGGAPSRRCAPSVLRQAPGRKRSNRAVHLPVTRIPRGATRQFVPRRTAIFWADRRCQSLLGECFQTPALRAIFSSLSFPTPPQEFDDA